MTGLERDNGNHNMKSAYQRRVCFYAQKDPETFPFWQKVTDFK